MGNASWNNGIFEVRTEPFNEYANKVFWATGSGFNGVSSAIYDELLNVMGKFVLPVDFAYYEIFGRGKSYSPKHKFITDHISMPNERYINQIPNVDRFIKSEIIHGR